METVLACSKILTEDTSLVSYAHVNKKRCTREHTHSNRNRRRMETCGSTVPV